VKCDKLLFVETSYLAVELLEKKVSSRVMEEGNSFSVLFRT
jgi:hypothetical protein